MRDENAVIEQRLQNMKDIYFKMEEMIDKLPDAIPNEAKTWIKDKIFGDRELKQLMDGIDSHRPPRILLIGRTGVGKSSLINALSGAYLATVNDTRSCTKDAEIYNCMDGNRVLFEICDTRGIAESESVDENVTAEKALIDTINAFSPDVAILMLNCTHRDDVDKDVTFLLRLAKAYENVNNVRLPIVVVVNKCDEVAPTRFKDPKTYPQSKIRNIENVVKYYKDIIIKNKLKIDDIIPVSSLIDWKTPDGIEIDAESIADLPLNDVERLEIAFDGRYHIEELLDILEKAILDYEAQMGLRMAARLTETIHRMAKHLNHIFSTMSAGVAATSIPISDIYVLLILQAVLVTLIASLSGRVLSLKTAIEFILSMSGIAGLGYGLRTLAQQASRLINLKWKGAGTAVSTGIAWFGTHAIGKAAIAYYIDGVTKDEAKKKYDEVKDDYENRDSTEDNEIDGQ